MLPVAVPRTSSSGPRTAKVVIVGEAPGKDEEGKTPFLGMSGQELDKMLFESGFKREECFLTNVANVRPPDNKIEKLFLDKACKLPGPEIVEGVNRLWQDLDEIKPNLVIALGNTPLWALRGHRKISSWRGSELQAQTKSGHKYVLIPTYHPAAVLRMWNYRALAVADLRRAKKYEQNNIVVNPGWKFTTRPSYQQVIDRLNWLLECVSKQQVKLSVDIETRHGLTACMGLAWSKTDALCIPFMDTKNPSGYWTLEEEYQIVLNLRILLCHPNCLIIGQNFLYDNQYNAKHWGIAPPVWMDTMIAQHVCFPGLPKKLEFLSSMWCEFHEYWKDDGKHFDPTKHDEDQLWIYNCVDCVRTYEIAIVLDSVIDALQRREQYEFQMRELYPLTLEMMFAGVDVDKKLRGELAMEVFNQIAEREKLINYFVERPINVRSPKQLAELFYEEFRMPKVYNAKAVKREDGTKAPSTDEDALNVFWHKEKLLKPLCGAIIEVRSLGTSINILKSPLDEDGRWRSSFNQAGAETFRYSSSTNAFDGGTNFQNLTSGGKSEFTNLRLPNMRRIIIPPPDHMISEIDLERADLQVVVWESEDDELKFAIRTGIDLHLFNAKVLFPNLPYNLEDLKDPVITEKLKKRFFNERQVAKVFCHATNYLGKAYTVAKHCGLGVRETEQKQAMWFRAHPGIKDWHERIANELAESRSVRNKFGYVRFYFDRIEECLNEGVAWIPQSTVAIVIDKILVNLRKNMKNKVKIRLQVHDSGVFTFAKSLYPEVLDEVKQHSSIVIPYDDPLIIPVGFKVSDKSWGDCIPPAEFNIIPGLSHAG